MSSAAKTASGSVPKADSSRCTSSKGDPFDLDHWQVPEAIDWGKWDVDSQSADAVRFRKRMSLTNYSGTPFDDRRRSHCPAADGQLTSPRISATPLGTGVRMVAFESSNTVTNAGREPWQPKSGLVSVWILGMFTPSPDTTIAIPFVPEPESTLGPIVNDAYFGKVPGDRLRVKEPVIFFRGDGQYRSKIGFSPLRARLGRRQLRWTAARADARAVHASARRQRVRQLDVGNAARAVQGRRRSTATTTVRRRRASRRLARFTSWKRHRRRSACRPTSSTRTSIAPFI